MALTIGDVLKEKFAEQDAHQYEDVSVYVNSMAIFNAEGGTFLSGHTTVWCLIPDVLAFMKAHSISLSAEVSIFFNSRIGRKKVSTTFQRFTRSRNQNGDYIFYHRTLNYVISTLLQEAQSRHSHNSDKEKTSMNTKGIINSHIKVSRQLTNECIDVNRVSVRAVDIKDSKTDLDVFKELMAYGAMIDAFGKVQTIKFYRNTFGSRTLVSEYTCFVIPKGDSCMPLTSCKLIMDVAEEFYKEVNSK